MIIACVLIHYEFLYRATLIAPLLNIKHRFRILVGIIVALVAHAIEVWIFAIAYFYMHQSEGWGQLTGNFDASLLDCVYYSFATYTTLGFGDIVPLGNIRFLTGLEALTGLVMITWTASFLFYEMQRYWGAK